MQPVFRLAVVPSQPLRPPTEIEMADVALSLWLNQSSHRLAATNSAAVLVFKVTNHAPGGLPSWLILARSIESV